MNIDTTKITWHQFMIYTSCKDKWEIIFAILLIATVCGLIIFLIKQIPINKKFKSFLSSTFSMVILIVSALFPTILMEFVVNLTGMILGIISSIIILAYIICSIIGINLKDIYNKIENINHKQKIN